jgi:hypothetical protein
VKITTTNELTAYAVKVFRQAGFFCWRENTTGIWDQKAQAFRKNPNTMLGKSDILGFHRTTGQFLACEIKTGKDRLSGQQEVFLLEVRNAGGLAVVVRHGADLEPYLTKKHT